MFLYEKLFVAVATLLKLKYVNTVPEPCCPSMIRSSGPEKSFENSPLLIECVAVNLLFFFDDFHISAVELQNEVIKIDKLLLLMMKLFNLNNQHF